MGKEKNKNERKVSLLHIFRLFLKTERKRVLLTLISGIIIFIVLTGISMAAYNYRFNVYKDYINKNDDWMADGYLSVSSSRFRTGNVSVESNYLENLTNDFTSLITDYVPDASFNNVSAGLSAQIFTYDPTIPGPEKYVVNELLTMDNRTYSVLNNSLLEGRMPKKLDEVLLLERDLGEFSINERVELYSSSDCITMFNVTVVGIVEIPAELFLNNSASADIFDWDFYGYSGFYTQYKECTFVTNFTSYREMLKPIVDYRGFLTYLVDVDYNLDGLQLSNLNDLVESFPKENEQVISPLISYKVRLMPDLKLKLLEFMEYWVGQLIRLFTLNIPLIFIIGLVCSAILNIGSEKLETSFRRMKLHGLSYNTIRFLSFLEDAIFSLVSLLGGFSLGIGISYLTTFAVDNPPSGYFIDFLTEPLLYMLIGVSFLGFFLISFIIHNSIAKKSTITLSEEFKEKRSKIREVFSTNEFRLLTVALVFSLISFVLYYLYNRSEALIPITYNIEFITTLWFLVSFSAVFVLTFIFLLISRLITLIWTLLSRNVLKKKVNVISLVLKQLTVSKKSYQFTILTALIFGLLVLPTAFIGVSIENHLENEIVLNLGEAPLILDDWVDPENERDYILSNIEEIENFTEIIVYDVRFYNYGEDYESAFRLSMVAVEDPETFLEVIGDKEARGSGWSDDALLKLYNFSHIMLDKKSAARNNLQPGDNFYTNLFTRKSINFVIEDTFNHFPLAPIPKRGLFEGFVQVFTMVGSEETIREISRDMHFESFIYSTNYKLIKPTNESVIPTIREKLSNYVIKDYNDLYQELLSEINVFPMNNLVFYIFLIFAVIVFIGYFTGLKTYNERVRIVEALYRSGATREQILGFFAIECAIINTIPMLIAMLVSLPLLRIVAIYSLAVQEDYYHYRPGIPFWIFILVLVLGIIVSIAGWLLAMIPQIRGYRPVKQE